MFTNVFKICVICIKPILTKIQILSYILTYITFEKFLSFSFCEYKVSYIRCFLIFSQVNSPRTGYTVYC